MYEQWESGSALIQLPLQAMQLMDMHHKHFPAALWRAGRREQNIALDQQTAHQEQREAPGKVISR